MATKREIELIPEEIEEARRQARKFRIIRLICFGFLGAAGLVVFLLLSAVTAESVALRGLEKEVSEKRAEIDSLADIEKKVIGLADKNNALNEIFLNRSYYSIFLEALNTSTPSGIFVSTLSVGKTKGTIDLNGEALGYNQLAQFLRNLVDENLGGTIFTKAALSSVTADANSGKSRFVVSLSMPEDAIQEGWDFFSLPETE